MKEHNRNVLVGLLFALPFTFLNALVVYKVKWFISLVRPEDHTSLFEQVIIFGSLSLVFVGGVIALLPVFKKGMDGKRNFYILNVIIGLFLVVFSTMILFALGEELYRCEFLKIPNCD